MRTASNNLINLLANSTKFYMAEIYDITLVDATVLRYTSLDRDVSYNSANYSANGILINRGRLSLRRGIEVDELEVEIYPTTANIGNVGWLQACRLGALDGARVKLQRLFYPDWNSNATGGFVLFNGRVADIDPLGRSGMSLKIKSDKELFNVQWPFNVYLAQCGWMLYGNGCGANKTTFTANGNVAANSTTTVIKSTVAAANNYYDQGVIKFTSGNCNGVYRTVKSFANASGQVTVILPLPYTPAANETFQIYPGCDHNKTTCNNRFTNANNFRGFPYVPTPESGV